MELTKNQRSLLLFLETQAVDYSGRVEARCMNEEDRDVIMPELIGLGLVEGFGRIAAADINDRGGRLCVHWVHLTEAGHELAGKLRKEKAQRSWTDRIYKTTKEVNE